MRKLPNKYRNPLGPSVTSYMVLVGIIVATTGLAYVYMKNQQLAQEDKKRDLEEDIIRFGEESERLKLKIDVHLGRQHLLTALAKEKSQLDLMPPGAVTVITPAPLPGQPNVLLSGERVAYE